MRAYTACLLILPMVVVSAVALLTVPRRARAADTRSEGLFWDEATLAFVRAKVAGTYVDSLSEGQQKDAFYRALEAYVELDPYCDFIRPDEYKQWQESTSGEYGGLGIRIESTADGLKVLGVLPGGPASKAGLVPGDVIVSADGRALGAADPRNESAVRTLKGAPGAAVRLVVRPAPAAVPGGAPPSAAPAATREVVAVREVVRPPAVFARRVGPGERVGVIRVSEFTETTPQEFTEALNAFVEQKLDGLVLDLRDNVGGVLKSAVFVVDRFLSKGVIVRMEGRAPGANNVYMAEAQPRGPYADVPDSLPLVVLVNGSSASASEIVSGALQDHRRAVLVGERTYGKFLVQQITEAPRGDCAVQLVTARYYTPSGRSYQRHARGGGLALPPGRQGAEAAAEADEAAGLLPDIVQGLTKDERKRLLEVWDNEEDLRWGSAPKHADVPVSWIDPQLQRALDVFAGELIVRKMRPAAPRNG